MSGLKLLMGSLSLENKPIHKAFASWAKQKFKDYEGYFAYKLTTLGRSSEEDIPSFIFISRECGVVLIDIVEDKVEDAIEQEGREFWRMESGRHILARNFVSEIYVDEVKARLKNDLSLYDRKKKDVKVPISSFVVFAKNSSEDFDRWYYEYASYDAVSPLSFQGFDGEFDAGLHAYNCTQEVLGKILSLIEGTFIYQDREGFHEERDLLTKSDFIKESLNVTFRQDDAQRVASMQLPPGPQRIRGLAGTGKTIVLSLKAAISHKRFEDFKILYLFNTQSLYSSVTSLITRYYTLEAKRAPDFESKIDVFHAWGGRSKPGLYSTICADYGVSPLTFDDVRGYGDSLSYIYRDLLKKLSGKVQPKYDLVLIDEAQDFPVEIFEMVYLLTKGEGASKRIIWAYDEFQSLKESKIKEPEDLFGVGPDGQPNIPNSAIEGVYDGDIPKDFILPNCYRTPRSVLMVAHGIAMGLQSPTPNHMFYTRREWEAIGYKVVQPEAGPIEPGMKVVVERSDSNSRNILENLLIQSHRDPAELINFQKCENFQAEIRRVVESVVVLIKQEMVPPEEIVIVNMESGNNKASMIEIRSALSAAGIRAVLPGYVESSDVFKPKGFVTITTPFRAKGNEANVVFVMNAHRVVTDLTLRQRNAFFVAMTRARGWCYITGSGNAFDALGAEISKVRNTVPRMEFLCPSRDQVRSKQNLLNKSDAAMSEIQKVLDLAGSDPDIKRLLEEALRRGDGD